MYTISSDFEYIIDLMYGSFKYPTYLCLKCLKLQQPSYLYSLTFNIIAGYSKGISNAKIFYNQIVGLMN